MSEKGRWAVPVAAVAGWLNQAAERLKWYQASLIYDWKVARPGGAGLWPYLLTFRLGSSLRCAHRGHRLGRRCIRERTYDSWCGLHNDLCWSHEGDTRRASNQEGRNRG